MFKFSGERLLFAALLATLFASSLLYGRQDESSLFENDFYPAAMMLEPLSAWDINDRLLSDSAKSGQVVIDSVVTVNNKPTLCLKPTKESEQVTVSWNVPVNAGSFYRFSGVSRCSPPVSTAASPYGYFSIRWLDSASKVIGGRDKLMSRPGGETFWNIKEAKAIAPPGAVNAQLTLTAGCKSPADDSAVWFGRLGWEKICIAPVKLELYPRMLRSAGEPIEIRVSRTHHASVTADGQLVIELLDASGGIIRNWISPNLITLPWIVKTKLPKTAASGTWSVRAKIEPFKKNPPSAAFEVSEPILIANSNPKLENGRFVFDQRKGFLIGIYHALAEDYPLIKKAGFNTVICKSYDVNEATATFDGLSKLGLYGFLSIGGGGHTRSNQPRVEPLLKKLQNHPAILAIDLMDEPTRKGVGPREIASHGVWAQSIAPAIPTTVNSCGPDSFERFVSTVDVFSVDPYPMYTWADYGLTNADIGQVSQWLNLVRKYLTKGRGFIGVIECFTFDRQRQPPATADELKNMVFQTVASGASGVMYYSFREPNWNLAKEPQFEAIGAINRELKRIEPYIIEEPLSPEISPLCVDSAAPERLISASWRNGNNYMTIIINLERQSQRVEIAQAGRGRHKTIDGSVLPSQLDLKPLAVEILEYKASN